MFSVLRNARYTKKMGPIAAGNVYKHSLYACAKYSVYSEGTNDAFTVSQLNMEMLIVG